jgi:hypothetical protein
MKLDELTQETLDTLVAEKDKMTEALERYKKENKKFREERDDYKAQAEAGEVNEKFKKSALTAEAKLRLANNGIKDPDRILKYLSFDGVEFAEDGTLTGLDDKIEAVKTDFPELFDAKRRVGGRVDAAADNPVNTAKSTTEMQVDKIFANVKR